LGLTTLPPSIYTTRDPQHLTPPEASTAFSLSLCLLISCKGGQPVCCITPLHYLLVNRASHSNSRGISVGRDVNQALRGKAASSCYRRGVRGQQTSAQTTAGAHVAAKYYPGRKNSLSPHEQRHYLCHQLSKYYCGKSVGVSQVHIASILRAETGSNPMGILCYPGRKNSLFPREQRLYLCRQLSMYYCGKSVGVSEVHIASILRVETGSNPI
jgi:hypothetical protein